MTGIQDHIKSIEEWVDQDKTSNHTSYIFSWLKENKFKLFFNIFLDGEILLICTKVRFYL